MSLGCASTQSLNLIVHYDRTSDMSAASIGVAVLSRRSIGQLEAPRQALIKILLTLIPHVYSQGGLIILNEEVRVTLGHFVALLQIKTWA